MAVIAPDAPKAATVDGADVVHVPLADIAKWEDGPDGSLYVYGRATTPEIDTDEQIVKQSWSGPALKEWLDKAPALRVQHNGQRDPAGSGLKVEINRDGDGAHWVKGVVDEPVAQRLVRKGHLRAFSVGIQSPVIERDMSGKARGGIITGGRIVEVSLVDSPANRSCFLEVVKAAADGSPEWTGKLTASDDVLAKVAEPGARKTVTVELPKNMSLSVKPSDLAKLATFKQRLTQQAAAVTKTAEPDAVKRDFDPDVGGGVDRDKLPASDFAGEHRSFPIVKPGDVSDAASSLGRERGQSRSKIKRRIIEIAHRKGPEFVAELPAAWRKKGKKKANKSASAKPDVTKCMKCDGSGMAEGKPCPECPKGRKKGRRMAAKALAADLAKKKKTKVMCSNCGAKQNSKHEHCAECGRTLPRAMPAVVKNHDFACLGCGHDLDKGERFCPHCGRENPGHNPMADHKIPANKAAKERVNKASKRGKKKGKKGGKEPFGGHEAPPFGSEDKDGKKGKKPPKAEKRRKGKGKGRSPVAGVTGMEGSTMPLPPHREPDGPPVEMFERTANLEDGDEAQEMAAARRHKALAAKGMSRDEALLHDLTCPAFSPASLARALPHATLAGTDDAVWQQKALATAAEAPLAEAGQAMSLWQHAVTLKQADPQLVADLRAEAHQAFRKANRKALKAFRDATPGPGSFPTPGHAMPQQFQRPYIHAGHAAPSPQHAAPHSFPVPEGQLSAEDYTRGYLTAGHAADSPQNDTPRHEPQPASMEAGKPDRVYYRGTMRDNARQAMTAMHDHISRVFPDVCPMSPELTGTQKPAPPVPVGVGGPEPHRGKSTENAKAKSKAAKARARKRAKMQAVKRRRLEKRLLRKVTAGKLSVDKARRRLGLKPWKLPETSVPAPVAKVSASAPALSRRVLKAAVADAMAPVLERQAGLEKTIRKQRRALDAIASQPDTSRAPARGAMVQKTSAAPAGPLTVAQSAEQAQAAQLRMLYKEFRESPDPNAREAAYRSYNELLGLTHMPPRT